MPQKPQRNQTLSQKTKKKKKEKKRKEKKRKHMQIPFGKVTGPESIGNSHRTKSNSRARTLSQNHSGWENRDTG